jgi:hypothetical protein
MKSAVFVFLNGLVSIPEQVVVHTHRVIYPGSAVCEPRAGTNASVVTMGQAHIRLFVDHPEAIPVKEGMTPVPAKLMRKCFSTPPARRVYSTRNAQP